MRFRSTRACGPRGTPHIPALRVISHRAHFQSTGDVPVVVSGQKPLDAYGCRQHHQWRQGSTAPVGPSRVSCSRKVQSFSCRHELLLHPQSCRYTAPVAIYCPPEPNVQSSAFGTWPSGRCNHTSHARAAVLWVGLAPRCPYSPFTSYKGGCDGGVRTHHLAAPVSRL